MKPLRLLLPLLFFCCAFTTTRAQYVTVPDTNFVSWLQAEYPNCMNGNQMDTTCADIVNDTSVQCMLKNIHDLTGVQYFDNLHTLDAYKNAVTFLPPLPSTLKRLIMYDNRLTSLDGLPSNLETLNADSNLLTALPALPASLQNLYVNDNSLDSLPLLPAGLQILECQANKLIHLPALNPSLKYLFCGNTELTGLPALPDSLVNLGCLYGNFTTLPAFPHSLQKFDILYVPITSLPTLPPNLNWLRVFYCQISSLPPLPPHLLTLNCGGNQLTSLPALPDSLRALLCGFNLLSSLPALPRTLEGLTCINNLLTSLPEMPDTISDLSCSDNPNLHCLPLLKTITNLRFDNTAVTCLPNYGNVTNSYPPLNSLPLCDPFNANNCEVYWNINGNVFHDTSGNCLQQNGETNIPYLKINLLQNGTLVQQAYTGQSGVYSLETPTGDYTVTIDTTGIPFSVLCPTNGFDSVSITFLDSTTGDLNFAMQCKPGFDVGVHSITSDERIRPAAFNTVYVQAGDMAQLFGQTCNTANLSGQLVLTFTGPATYVSPAPNALTPVVNGNTLSYTVNDWSTVVSGDFDFIIQVDTTAQSFTQVCFDATVTPTTGDNDISNNHLTYCVTVVNSFDPNDKAVYPVSNVDVTGDHWLTYTVRFQNTGNAPAEHIYITDTIDTDVDIETFQLLAYSFAPQVIIKGNAVRFNFANINLPDSVNDEPNSHGYVQYKVKIKDNATVGTFINNTAFIYFDFNAPVVTNTTTNTLALPNGITTVNNSTATMQLYPNPANEVVMINLSDNLTGGSLTLSDVTGRSLNTINITSTHNQLNTGALASGVYLVTAIKGGVRVVQRLVVSR